MPNDDDETPVASPMDPMDRRQRATLNALGTIRIELRESVDRDMREHAQLNHNLRNLGEHVDDLRDKVSDMRETSARIEGKLEVLIDSHNRMAELAVSTVKTEAEHRVNTQRFELEDKADARRTKRRAWLKLLGIGGSIVGGASGLAALMSSC